MTVKRFLPCAPPTMGSVARPVEGVGVCFPPGIVALRGVVHAQMMGGRPSFRTRSRTSLRC